MIATLSILAALSSGPANSQLCGRSYQSVARLDRDLHADRKISRFPARDELTVYYDRDKYTLWWVRSVKGKPVVVSCKRKIATNNGYVDGNVEADCNSDKSGICAIQASRMAAVKF